MHIQAIDHIINSAAKSNYMSAGQISVPIVFRDLMELLLELGHNTHRFVTGNG